MNNNENPNNNGVVNNGAIPTINPVENSNQPIGNVPTINPIENPAPVENMVPTVNPVEAPTENTIPTVNPVKAPTENTIPTVNPVEVQAENTVPTVNPVETPVINPETTPVVPPVEGADPRSVGIDNTEFIHPVAFDKTHSQETGAVVPEKLKKVEVEYKPPSKFKMGLMIVFFIFLIAFVIFLPDVTTFVDKKLHGNGEEEFVKITNGRMVCTLNSNTTNLDKNYEYVFHFTDNKLEKVEYSITTKGDPTLDEEQLNGFAATCKQLAQDVESVQGVNVRCKYTEGKLVELQSFELKTADMTKVKSAFAEAGGNYPEYPYGQDMDIVEKNLNAGGFSCSREY